MRFFVPVSIHGLVSTREIEVWPRAQASLCSRSRCCRCWLSSGYTSITSVPRHSGASMMSEVVVIRNPVLTVRIFKSETTMENGNGTQ